MIQIIVTLLIIRVIVWMLPGAEKFIKQLFSKVKQKIMRRKNDGIFDNNYIKSKTYFLQEFGKTPCISFINNLDTAKVYDYINKGFAGKVLATYQRNFYSWQRSRQEFSCTIFKLENQVMIEVGDEYAEILFGNNNYTYANELVKLFSTYQAPEKERL